MPVLYPTTSILEYRQHQSWAYQPLADSEIVTWTATGLPAGMSIDAGTGLISGAATVPGVFLVSVIGTDYGAVSSLPLVFPVAIEPTVGTPTGSAPEIYIDPVTGAVTRGDGAAGDDAVFTLKENDDLLLLTRWRRNGTVLEVPVVAVRFTLKEFEPENEVLVSTVYAASGAGESSQCLIYIKATRANLESLLTNYEDDTETAFYALAEIEWGETNGSGIGPDTLRRTSQTFRVRIVRDLGEVTIA